MRQHFSQPAFDQRAPRSGEICVPRFIAEGNRFSPGLMRIRPDGKMIPFGAIDVEEETVRTLFNIAGMRAAADIDDGMCSRHFLYIGPHGRRRAVQKRNRDML